MSNATAAGMCKLKYLATINDESLGEDTDPDFEIKYVDIGNVDSSGNVGDLPVYRFEEAPSRARRRVRDGDVIISTVRTYLQAITQFRHPPANLVASTGFAVVRPERDRFDANYCKYALREPSFLAEVETRSVGVSYPAINSSDLAAIPVHVHPISQQRAIADYLDRETGRLDALVAVKERLLGLLAEKRRALITHAVTRGLDPHAPLRDSGIPWLGKIPAHWDSIRLRFLVHKIEQGWSPEAEKIPPGDEDWGVLKLNAVARGRFDQNAAKKLPSSLAPRVELEVHEGDVLLTRANTPHLVGDACFVAKTRPRLMLCDLIYRLDPRMDTIDGRYLTYFLTLDCGRAQIESDARGTSGSMVKISQEHIKSWWIPVPPVSEQHTIVEDVVTRAARIDAMRSATRATIRLLRERRSALIAAAVTGQLDSGSAA